ncbi:retrovirus-related pol polyprotein from transposon TNT 1-94 [Tanacetum coccineum]
MEFESAQSGTTAKLPILKLGEYEMWVIRIKQYFQVQDYALWEVIENGNSWVSVPKTAQENGTSVTKMSVPVTAEEKTNKKNDVKARSLLLMALPNEHQLTFSQYTDAKTMFAAIETRFGGNEATKKTQKTLLKQQYENFSASSAESLDSIFNRLQKIVSKLAILGLVISQEDLNSKFLSSLPPKLNTHVVVWMNKAEIETMSIDDLYNNFKIVEQKVKKSVGASSGAQNLAFMTAPSTSSTNDVNTAIPAYEVSTASPNVNTASPQVSTASFSDNDVYAFMVENPNGSNPLQQDSEQIHKDDLEAMDLKWQLSLLSMRAKRYYQRTGKKIFINANDTARYDKSKVECFNYHKMGHFARECRAPRNKEGQFRNQDNTKKQGNNEDTSSKGQSATYKRGLATVEEQLITYRKNEVLFSEKVAVLKREVACKYYEIDVLKSEFEKVKQEKVGIEFKIEKFNKASKDLDKLLGSSLMHKKYCLVVTDDYSRFAWVFFLTTKDETSEILKNFIKEIENLVDKKVKIIRCDNGTEFKNKVMDDFCREKGIKREYSVARTPQQNGVADRRNKTLIEAARTMLADSKLPTTFWAEAVNTTCYVQNRVLVVKPHNKTPYELFRGFKPALSFMRPFGCHVTILNTLDNLGKFDDKSDEEGNGPKWLFDIDSLTQSMNYVPVAAGIIINESAGTQGELNAGTSEEISQDCIVEDGPDNENDEKDKYEDDSSPKEVNIARQHVNTANPKVNTGRFKLNTVDPSVNTASSYDQDSPKDMFIMGASHTHEATHVEFFNLPIGKRAIGTKWVFRNKKDKRGIVIRNKARLVTQGHRQEEGIDYEEVFALVARIEAIRLFLAYASFMGFLVYQMDVKSAFLYGTIEEDVYVTQPPGFKDPDHPDKVYKVVKALYGLHQAPRAWYETLSNYLLGNGFQRGKIDKTLFIKKQKGDILLVQVYVDDIIFGSTNKELFTAFEKLRKDKFQMSSMGELTFFLGLQVQQKEDGIFINQDKYVAEILKKFNYIDVKSASTPVDLEKLLVKDGDVNDVDVHLYRSMIGSLMYLTAPRPDIMFAVCACARFQVNTKDITISFSNLLTKGKAYGIPNVECFTSKVGDEAVHKELGDRMERDATTASSLEAEQDSGNINKTQSMATLNGSSP